MFPLALALACCVTAGGSWPQDPHLARVTLVRGLPVDPGAQARFLEAFQAELVCRTFPVERDSDDDDAPPEAAPNRFSVSDDADPDSAWVVEISLGSPRPLTVPIGHTGHRRVVPQRSSSRGMVAALTISPPHAGDPRAVPTSDNEALLFPPPPPPADAAYGVPATGYAFPWEEAGRAVARLALDALHHRSGQLADGERIGLAPAVRAQSGR
jgi:hypothetical protein